MRLGKVLIAIAIGWALGVAGMTVSTVRDVPLANAYTAPQYTQTHTVYPNLLDKPHYVAPPKPAGAAVQDTTAELVVHRTIPRWQAYLYAIFHERGCWYVWGGNGPCWAGYDCSGLVVAAYAHVGIYLPRTTWEMLSYWRVHFIPWNQAKAGDLVFMYGGAHVELYTGHWGRTFGAHSQGTVSSFTWWSNVYGIAQVTGAG